jgi:hypothetical protein
VLNNAIKFIAIVGIFALFCFLGRSAQASCFNPNSDSRLLTYCLSETFSGNSITLDEAILLDTLLKREGFNAGLGLPNQVAEHSSQVFAAPLLSYNSNINGGNPDQPLTLGALTFNGDPSYRRRDGIVGGAAIGLRGRSIYANGSYLDFSVAASYAHSTQHDIGIARASVSGCSRNYMFSEWYLDACGDITRLVRDLDAETTRGFSLGTTKLFTLGNNTVHSTSVGIRRHYTENYQQNQLQLGWNTLSNSGRYTGFSLSFGEALPNQLVMRSTASVTIGTRLFDRDLTLSIGYSYADGGRILGFERNDTTYSMNVNFNLTSSLSLNIGFRDTSSSISYFNEREPLVSLELVPIRF